MRKLGPPDPGATMPSVPGWPAGEEPYRLLVESIRDCAIFLLDARGTVQSWNEGAALMTGYTAPEIVGQTFAVLYTPADVMLGHPQRHLDLAARRGRVEDQGWRVRKDGLRFWADVSLAALRDGAGALYGFAQIARDLTEHRRREAELKRTQDRSSRFWNEAIKDPLTGVFNRRYMIDRLRDAVDRREQPLASLLVFDIDRFKAINDRYGHVRGDAVLTGVASIARRQLRESDLLFRLGGDEFVIYLPGVDARGAATIAERLRQAVERGELLPGAAVTVSIGVAQLRPVDSAHSWIEHADAALYRAKNSGRNRVA